MSDWQWFEDFEAAALARGDRERVHLRQIHREAFGFRETDPDHSLRLLAEGRRLALTLEEPWWVMLFDHWQVHITLYDKRDYRDVLELAVRNALEVRKSQYIGFPQKLWILGDLIDIYVNLEPRGYAGEIELALAELEAELTPEMDNARYLFRFHQLDAAYNQDRVEDAMQIALGIRADAQADPVRSTGDHYLINIYRCLCDLYYARQDWIEVATWAEAGEALARQYGHKQPVSIFLMWQAVVSQQCGEKDKAAHCYHSAISRMGNLRTPPERDYYDAICGYHELCGNLEKSLQLRAQEVQDFLSRGKVYDEFEARLAHLRMLVQMGREIEPQLSETREATRKFQRPEFYWPKIEQIAGKVDEEDHVTPPDLCGTNRMTAAIDAPIPVGQPHLSLCDIEMLVYDYDRVSHEISVLPAGTIFQPWDGPDHWRGEEVPITLGDQAEEFDWGKTSWDGHFLRWGDFFSKCRLVQKS